MPSKDYTPSAWTSREFEFTLPSGDVCLLRKIDPLLLAEKGLLTKLDFTTNVVMTKHVKNAQLSNVERVKRDRARREAKARGEDPDAVTEEESENWKNLITDEKRSAEFRITLDNVLVLGVVAPQLHLPPDNDEERMDGWFYTDAIPFGDKIAVFSKLMEGVKLTEQFREGSEATVGDVASKSGVQPTAKRSTRPNRKGSAS